jgi:AmiR/NasT family two-component response regulator
LSKPRILVFEADAAVNQSIRVVLEAAGYGVSQAFEHAAARQALDAGSLDFALLDMSAPQLGELHLAPALARSQAPFVIMSMHQHPALVQRAVEIGAMGYFLKPLDVSVIVLSIRAWLARATELQQLAQAQRSLREAVRSNRSIGTAVGMIMERHRLTPERAFETLRRQARSERVSVLNLSVQIVDGMVEVQAPGGEAS